MLGSNRHGNPVVVRLFRPEQTRALLVGGVRCAQLIALRAMALGARVVVQTARPQAWEPFVRGAAVPGESIAVVPPGRAFEIAPGSALHPLLVVVDVGPVGADTRPGAGWQATLVVRDEFTPADVDVASRADLLILQPLARRRGHPGRRRPGPGRGGPVDDQDPPRHGRRRQPPSRPLGRPGPDPDRVPADRPTQPLTHRQRGKPTPHTSQQPDLTDMLDFGQRH